MSKKFGNRFYQLTAIWLSVNVLGNVGGVFAQQTGQPPTGQNLPIIKRAKRPTFTQKDSAGVFFADIFSEGFSGERPENFGRPARTQVVGVTDTQPDPTAGETSNGDNASWSGMISATVLENEIKRLQILLDSQITTPTKFKSEHYPARLTFAQLAMLFGVIENYDGEVRWKQDAPFARVALARAAANSRTGSQQAYAHARNQRDALKEMVRGARFPQDGQIEKIEWSAVVDRGALMEIAEELFQEGVKPMSASSSEARKHVEELVSKASVLAVIGQVLASPEMDDYDEEDYAVYAFAMRDGATEVISGSQTNNYPMIERGVNAIGQSCSNCHDEWR